MNENKSSTFSVSTMKYTSFIPQMLIRTKDSCFLTNQLNTCSPTPDNNREFRYPTKGDKIFHFRECHGDVCAKGSSLKETSVNYCFQPESHSF